MIIHVVGPMSSGNRLLRDLIQQSGIATVVDTSHGTRDLDPPGPVVLIERDRAITMRSIDERWPAGEPERVEYDDSIAGITARRYYSTCLTAVTYRQIVTDPADVIRRVAHALGVEPWRNDVHIIDTDPRWTP